MRIDTFAFRKPTLWERIKHFFGVPLPKSTQLGSGGIYQYTGLQEPGKAGIVVDEPDGETKALYDAEGKQFVRIDDKK